MFSVKKAENIQFSLRKAKKVDITPRNKKKRPKAIGKKVR